MEPYQAVAIIAAILIHSESGRTPISFGEENIRKYVETADLILQAAIARQPRR